MIIRPYGKEDFLAVFSLINACAEADRTRHVTREGLAVSLDSANPEETALITAYDGTLYAFAWWEAPTAHVLKVEGWVFPEARRRGLGKALMRAAETYAQQRLGGAQINTRTYEDLKDAVRLFQGRGYTLTRRFYQMRGELTADRDFNLPVPETITFRAFDREHLDNLVEADNEIFSEHWGSYPRSVTEWEKHMFGERQHDPSLWVIAWHGDQIIGECLCGPSRDGGPEDGWVTIVGVRRSWRGRGLGRVLLAHGMKNLRDHGFKTASLHVDADNDAAVNLYRSLEMDVVRTRLHFGKYINARGGN